MWQLFLYTVLLSTSKNIIRGQSTSAIRIFIDQVPEYALLSSCAEAEVSTIIRDMSYGCGDHSHTTSYVCFCYSSSTKFSSMIGAHVSTACPSDPSQNTSAIEVFSSYCQLGSLTLRPTGTDSINSTTTTVTSRSQSTAASPASGPATVTVTAPPTSSPQSPKKSNNTVAIAAGITVPVVLIALAIIGFLIWRQRKSNHSDAHELGTDVATGREVYELKPNTSHTPPVEAEGDLGGKELDLTAKERTAYVELPAEGS